MKPKYTDQELTDCGARVLGLVKININERYPVDPYYVWQDKDGIEKWDCVTGEQQCDDPFSPPTKIDQALMVADKAIEKRIITSYSIKHVGFYINGKFNRVVTRLTIWQYPIGIHEQPFCEEEIESSDCARKIMEAIKEQSEVKDV